MTMPVWVRYFRLFGRSSHIATVIPALKDCIVLEKYSEPLIIDPTANEL